MMSSLKEIGVTGEQLRIEYTCAFQEYRINGMKAGEQVKWAHFLRSNGIMVKSQRGYPRRNALVDCLDAESFPEGIMKRDKAGTTTAKEICN